MAGLPKGGSSIPITSSLVLPSAVNYGGLRRRQLLNVEKNQIRRIGAPDLTKLKDLPRAEAMRIAMIKHGWDAATAGRKVDIEQSRFAEEMAGRENQQGA
jgi:hypothetical protein